MKIADIPGLMCQTELFAHTSHEEMEGLVKSAHLKTYQSGNRIFEEGDSATTFYFIVSGKVKMFRWAPNGEEKIYQVLKAGNTLAEIAMFGDTPVYPMNATVSQKAQLVCIERQVFVDFCMRKPEFSMHVMTAMAKKITSAMNRIDQLTMSNSLQRLVSYLLDLHIEQGSQWLELPVSNAELATQLAITPETLSRLLHKLREKELITNKRKTLVLLDVEELCDFAELPHLMREGLAKCAAGKEAMVGCCSL